MKKFVACLDAGHGCDTWEHTGGKGVKYDNGKVFEEHTFNAAVVGYTQELLEKCGIGVVLTQPLNQKEVPLKARTDLANSLGVDILVSFHADANANHDAQGHWVFHWYNSTKSKKLAQIWDKHANVILGTNCRGIQESKPNHWTNFHMVRETSMPAILIEHDFMTNKDGLQRLLSDDFRKKCAEVAAKAICEYFGMPYKVEVTKPPVDCVDNSSKEDKANLVKNQIAYAHSLIGKGGQGTWALNLLADVHDYMKSRKFL